jgi:uncharacterized membrane protein
MASFLKDSGALAVGVALLVAILSRVIAAPMPPKALFALAVLLFLIGLGVRSLMRWFRSKHKSPAGPGH